MEKQEKILIARMVITAIIFALTFFNFLSSTTKLILSVVALVIISYDIVIDLVLGIFKKEFESEKFLMLIASIGAFSIAEFHEGVAVMLLYQLGEFLQDLAVEKSKASIVKLMDIRPDYANLLIDENIKKVSPENVQIGDVLVVYAGEKIPLDGIVVEGTSSLDTMALTGESLPTDVSVGDNVISGAINLSSTIKIKVTKIYGESTVAKIIKLVEESEEKKAKSENFISKFAKIYTPVVVALAVLLAVLPPIIIGGGWSIWLSRALMLLVISCPCALVISVPLSFFAGIGGASKAGILIKGANHLETLAKAKTVAFDKTGTITKGSFKVTEIHSINISENELLELATLAESESNHPIAISLKNEFKEKLDLKKVKSTETLAGFGIKAKICRDEVVVGNFKLMQKLNIDCEVSNQNSTTVFVAKNGKLAGWIEISDEIKPESALAISNLKKLGIDKLVMLSGDKSENVKSVADAVGIDSWQAELLPEDKAIQISNLKSTTSGSTVFVGDGINDAPAFKTCDVGIAMGALGSDVAIESADIALMDDSTEKIADAIKISRKTMRLVKENIIFAISFKVFMLVLGALGIATMWLAVLADVGVSLIAVLNSLRALKVPKKK